MVTPGKIDMMPLTPPADPREKLIVAMTRTGVIGRAGALPWHLPEDLRLFRAATLGGCVIMGSRTYRTIGHPLAGRRNLVVGTTLPETAGVIRCETFVAAVTTAISLPGTIWYIGGADIYRQALPRVNEIYVSWVKEECDGDLFFPPCDWSRWETVGEENYADFIHRRYRRRGGV